MSARTNKICNCLNNGICEGAWFCYVVCLFVPVLMMLAVLVSALAILIF